MITETEREKNKELREAIEAHIRCLDEFKEADYALLKLLNEYEKEMEKTKGDERLK